MSNGRGASKAIDGDVGTEYHSNYGSDLDFKEQWIKFDLQDPSIISTVTIFGR